MKNRVLECAKVPFFTSNAPWRSGEDLQIWKEAYRCEYKREKSRMDVERNPHMYRTIHVSKETCKYEKHSFSNRQCCMSQRTNLKMALQIWKAPSKRTQLWRVHLRVVEFEIGVKRDVQIWKKNSVNTERTLSTCNINLFAKREVQIWQELHNMYMHVYVHVYTYEHVNI